MRFAQKTQSETTNGAPERPEVLPKWSTSKSNQRAQTKHQKVQSETTNGAPERPEVLPKRSTSKSNQRAQTKHQKVQSETTNGAPENQPKKLFLSRDFHLQLISIGQLTQLSQNYFALQSLHKALPSTTLYYKACTKHFPVLLCTTKLAQSTSQYYFVLQSLQKVFLSTTVYYTVAQSTSQYYFVVQSLHKARSFTTLL